MPSQPVITDVDLFAMTPGEVRFHEACHFYWMLKTFQGREAGTNNAFYWACHIDGFLMSIVSLREKHLTRFKKQLEARDAFRLMVVMRNISAHKAVVSSASPTGMISRELNRGAGSPNPEVVDFDNAILASSKVATALTNYVDQVKAEKMGQKTRWDFEQKNIEGALRWNAKLASQQTPTIHLSEVFLDVIRLVEGVCGFKSRLPASS